MEKVEDMMFGIKNIEGNDYTTEFDLHWVTFMALFFHLFLLHVNYHWKMSFCSLITQRIKVPPHCIFSVPVSEYAY